MNSLLLAFRETPPEDSPVKILIASVCACCGKGLTDALSMELGIGPVCRRRYGFYEDPQKPDWFAGRTIAVNYNLDVTSWHTARVACNVLVKLFSCDVVHNQWIPEAVYALGYTRLAEKMAIRGGRVEVRLLPEGAPTHYVVRAPTPGNLYNEVPGMLWDKKARVLSCPMEAKDVLWNAIRCLYPGLLLVTPRGITPIAAAPPL